MQGAEEQVTGERSMYANTCSFYVPYLANHYDVGVLPDYVSEAGGERKTYLRPHLYLIDAL